MTTAAESLSGRPSWVPRWMSAFPEAWSAFGEKHPIKVEEFRTDGGYVIRAELPGIDPEHDVRLCVDDDSLLLHAERRLHRRELEGTSFRTEIDYGLFERRIPLPVGAHADRLTATYTDGVLEVTIPTDDVPPSSTRVPITRG